MPRPISRRQALTFAVVGGAAVAAGGAGLVVAGAFDKQDLARTVLTRLVGPFRMSPENLSAFVSAFEATKGFPSGIKGDALALGQGLLGGRDLSDFLPKSAAERFESFERDLLTNFVMSTNFLRGRSGPDEDVVFVGLSPACTSPFAKFEPLAAA